jgi:homoserine dehydrogenase
LSAALRIGVAGLGTVGGGVLTLLAKHRDLVSQRAGRAIEVVAVAARDRAKDRGLDLTRTSWHDDPVALARDPGVEIVVELMGGSEGAAKALVEAALAAGKPVVTANKALIAHHGTALARLAEAHDTTFAFEAAVAGGIPVIKMLREGLAANEFRRIYGILNGTCNYILTTMRESGRDFAEVLADAQKLGYAEADPAFDVDGVDAAHKLAILAALAFGCEVAFDRVKIEGIRQVSALDIAYAAELGLRIKLIGLAQLVDGALEQRVSPVLVPLDAPIATVEGVFNAVVAEGDSVGTVMAEGRGAGAGPTASAVVADLIDIARGRALPPFALPAGQLRRLPAQPLEARRGAWYLRLTVVDRPGVIADVAAALRDEDISMESMLQRGRDPEAVVPVVITTHDTTEGAIRRALKRIEVLKAVVEPPCALRIEQF